jgi:hypothetical protein
MLGERGPPVIGAMRTAAAPLVVDGVMYAATAWSTQTTDPAMPCTITGAPRVAKGEVIIGNGGAEYGVRGYVTACDTETGNHAWRFCIVPGDPSRGFASEVLKKAAQTWASGIDQATGRPVENPEARYADAPALVLPWGYGGHSRHPMSCSPRTGLVYIPAMDLPTLDANPAADASPNAAWRIGVDALTIATLPDAAAERKALVAVLKGRLVAWDPAGQQEAAVVLRRRQRHRRGSRRLRGRRRRVSLGFGRQGRRRTADLGIRDAAGPPQAHGPRAGLQAWRQVDPAGGGAISGGVLPDLRYPAALADGALRKPIVLDGAPSANGMVAFSARFGGSQAEDIRTWVIGESKRPGAGP